MFYRKILSLYLLLVFGLLASLFHGVPSLYAQDCEIATLALRSASRLRKLPLKNEVPCKLQNKKEVEAYVLGVLDTEMPEEKLFGEGKSLELLGLAPRGMDYKKVLLSLYTSQLGGYYDPKQNYYAMAAWIPGILQAPIAVHELTHALQDQHFNLDDFLSEDSLSSDQVIARSALVEGDATALMLDYSRSLQGQGLLEDEADIGPLIMQQLFGATISFAATEAPEVLQAMLIFPYMSGLQYAHHQLRNGDSYKAIDKCYKNLPQSTEQILHPELCGSLSDKLKIKPLNISLPSDYEKRIKQGVEKETIHSDTLGEFFISIFLRQFVSTAKANRAASGWGNDKLSLYKMEKTYLLVWDFSWDSKEDSEEFFTVLKEGLAEKYKEVKDSFHGVHRHYFVESPKNASPEKKILLRKKSDLVDIQLIIEE